MRTSYTAVIERNTEIRDGFVSEGYECGWASEALLFLRVLDGDLAGASARIQISPDGMHWCDEGTSFPLASANPGCLCKNPALRELAAVLHSVRRGEGRAYPRHAAPEGIGGSKMHGLNEQDSKAEAPLISQKGKRVKDLIKEKIFTLILESNGISQKQIHHSFRIRPVDLSLAIKELEADGLILRSSVQEKRVRGRPEVFFVADSRRIVSFALYVESWNIYGVVLDMHGNEIYGCRQAIAGDASPETLFRAQLDLVSQLRSATPKTSEIARHWD